MMVPVQSSWSNSVAGGWLKHARQKLTEGWVEAEVTLMLFRQSHSGRGALAMSGQYPSRPAYQNRASSLDGTEVSKQASMVVDNERVG